MSDYNPTPEELAAALEIVQARTAELLADKVESTAGMLATKVEDTATAASLVRQDLAAKLAYEQGAEAARINERLGNLDGSVEQIKVSFKEFVVDITKRFDDQDKDAKEAKLEGRRLTIQVFSAVIVATIGAAAVIIVAIINSSPS